MLMNGNPGVLQEACVEMVLVPSIMQITGVKGRILLLAPGSSRMASTTLKHAQQVCVRDRGFRASSSSEQVSPGSCFLARVRRGQACAGV